MDAKETWNEFADQYNHWEGLGKEDKNFIKYCVKMLGESFNKLVKDAYEEGYFDRKLADSLSDSWAHSSTKQALEG